MVKPRFCILLILLLCQGYALADTRLIMNISESGKITSYFDTYWVVNVEGNVIITNPFNNSFDYLKFKFNLGTLTIIEDNQTDYVNPGEIYVPYIDAQESIEFDYVIRGISGYDPQENNRSVLRTAIGNERASLFTFLISNIKKSEIENRTIDTAEVKGTADRRLITVTLENPSDIQQNVSLVKVLKTPSQDPNNLLDSWYFPIGGDPILIPPRTSWVEDIIDYNSSDGEVYWLATEAQTDTVPLLVEDHIIRRFTEKDLYNVENASLEEQEYLQNLTHYLEHLMYMKKSVSQSRMIPGDLVEITVKVNNFAPINRYVNLTEQIPTGFTVLDSGGSNYTTGQSLFWSHKVNPDSSKIFTYQLEFSDNESVGLDYFEPAILKYENETLYSERLPFIRQYIPEKKIYIQKKLRYSVSDEIVVQIQLQNLGESSINNLYVKEFLGANDVFREISVAPESKGRWKIPVLEKGEIWEVTYVTNENEAVNLLPEVYGVDKKIILKTLVFENIIRNEWYVPAVKVVEIFAPVFILGFIIFYFVYHRRVYTEKSRGFKKLGKEIRKLKKITELRPQQKINLMKRESKTEKKIPSVGGYDIPSRKPPTKDSLQDLARENIDKLKDMDEDTKNKN